MDCSILPIELIQEICYRADLRTQLNLLQLCKKCRDCICIYKLPLLRTINDEILTNIHFRHLTILNAYNNKKITDESVQKQIKDLRGNYVSLTNF